MVHHGIKKIPKRHFSHSFGLIWAKRSDKYISAVESIQAICQKIKKKYATLKCVLTHILGWKFPNAILLSFHPDTTKLYEVSAILTHTFLGKQPKNLWHFCTTLKFHLGKSMGNLKMCNILKRMTVEQNGIKFGICSPLCSVLFQFGGYLLHFAKFPIGFLKGCSHIFHPISTKLYGMYSN